MGSQRLKRRGQAKLHVAPRRECVAFIRVQEVAVRLVQQVADAEGNGERDASLRKRALGFDIDGGIGFCRGRAEGWAKAAPEASQ